MKRTSMYIDGCEYSALTNGTRHRITLDDGRTVERCIYYVHHPLNTWAKVENTWYRIIPLFVIDHYEWRGTGIYSPA